MRATTFGLITLAFYATVPAEADNMADMKGMTKATPASKTGSGTGVVTAIDLKTSKLTIKHSAIAAIGWPAMTMAFKANPAFMLKGLKVGQKINFTVKTSATGPEVTTVR